MAKKAKELSAMAVSRIKQNGRFAVGGVDGLCLRVTGGSRSWVLRVMIDTKRCDIGLGGFPDVPLGEARDKARELRKQIRDGINPIVERQTQRFQAKLQKAKKKTFQECSLAYIDAHQAAWKNDKHRKQWNSTLENYAFPIIGKLPVDDIETTLVMQVIEPIWHDKTETANRLRGRIEAVLDWAAVRGYRKGENPARWKGHIDKLLPSRSKIQKVKHYAALPYSDLCAFMETLRSRNGISARALEFAILTAARSGEVRGAKWQEIDFKSKIWTIPANRMKAGKEHRIPLADESVQLLTKLPRIVGNEFLFPSIKGGQLSDMALTAILRHMDRGDLTQHGFRSTFRDWAGETTSYPREVIEHALAHQLKDKAEAAYQRGDLLEKRCDLMADWARYCYKNLQNI